jgi:hypothetical protein
MNSKSNSHIFFVAFALCLLFLVQLTFGQYNKGRFVRNIPAFGVLKVVAGGGAAYYMGDLEDGITPKNIRYQAALGLSYRLTERLTARGEFRYYRITGQQADTRVWYNNLSFRSDNFDGFVGVQIDLQKFSNQPRLNPYLLVGLGATSINPKANYQGTWYSLPPLQTEGIAYSRLAAIVVGGIGMSVSVNDYCNIGIELSDNFANSDYLDDVSTNYPDFNGRTGIALTLTDRRPELGLAANEAGNIRGNSRVKDSYGFLSVRVEYLLASRFRNKERRKLRCLR